MGNVIFRATDTFGHPSAPEEAVPIPQPPAKPVKQLPPELTRQVAVRLSARDRLGFALACKRNHAALAAELRSSRLSRRAASVRDIGALQALLAPETYPDSTQAESIPSLPKSLQVDPLLVLARRLTALPLHQQAQAAGAWDRAVHPLLRQSAELRLELDEQALAARMVDRAAAVHTLAAYRNLIGDMPAQRGYSIDGIDTLRPDLRLKPLLAMAVRVSRLPLAARRAAATLFQGAASRLGMEYRLGIERVERAAQGALDDDSDLYRLSLSAMVRSGESIERVVRTGGITDPEVVRALNYLGWGAAVKAGAAPREVAPRHGIENEAQLADAKRFAAISDIEFGEPPQTAVLRYGLADAGHIEELTELAAWEAEDAMLNGGATLARVIERYGIANAVHVAALTNLAFAEAKAALEEGSSLEAAITRYGITDPGHLAELGRLNETREGQWVSEFALLGECMLGVM